MGSTEQKSEASESIKIEEISETKEEVKIESSSNQITEIESTNIKKTSVSTVVESEEESDEDIPELEEEGIVPHGIQADINKIQSRGEKKARKQMQKLGLKVVPGINRVTIRRPKNILLVVTNPDVYKSPNSDCYIVFGEAKVEDLNSQAQANAAQQFQAAETAASSAAQDTIKIDEAAADEDEEEEDANMDESNVEAKDVELVMQQANVSRAKAIKALKNHNNDIVDAIMSVQNV
ncbi:hypothetical protein RclHR1_02660009 [Rhizophagus clarus]|uniref:Nascent polypeptide-associated complex subunit alpha n=1 Tax=Rhizophagus clarus TaxID=94130 RepID=A0A2Z6RVJ1_9GLOM|nr:hypothetical protein RclHR1_02660009 [Rhizophagus clarus]GES77653.1 nascent polypeptide-associated complex subunit alpha [Rhizophagus clarus]